MNELSAEFEKYLNTLPPQRVVIEDVPQYVAHMMRKSYLAGAAIGAKRERERVIKLSESISSNPANMGNIYLFRNQLAEAIREGKG